MQGPCWTLILALKGLHHDADGAISASMDLGRQSTGLHWPRPRVQFRYFYNRGDPVFHWDTIDDRQHALRAGGAVAGRSECGRHQSQQRGDETLGVRMEVVAERSIWAQTWMREPQWRGGPVPKAFPQSLIASSTRLTALGLPSRVERIAPTLLALSHHRDGEEDSAQRLAGARARPNSVMRYRVTSHHPLRQRRALRSGRQSEQRSCAGDRTGMPMCRNLLLYYASIHRPRPPVLAAVEHPWFCWSTSFSTLRRSKASPSSLSAVWRGALRCVVLSESRALGDVTRQPPCVMGSAQTARSGGRSQTSQAPPNGAVDQQRPLRGRQKRLNPMRTAAVGDFPPRTHAACTWGAAGTDVQCAISDP